MAHALRPVGCVRGSTKGLDVNRTGPAPTGVAILIAAATMAAACGAPAIDRSASPPGSVEISSSVVTHNSADVLFTLEMIRCHQQAIQISETVLAKRDVDARVVQMARQIQSMQTVALEHMQSWLRQWEVPVSANHRGCLVPETTDGSA
jgi:uncharacterized protein (DUF305 family)